MFTYSQLKEIYDGRRKCNYYRALKGYCNCEVRQDSDGDMYVTFHSNRIATFTPDNIVTLDNHGWFDSPTTRGRIYGITGVRIHTDRKYEDKTRANGLPYSDALRFRGGHCINPEVAVDTWSTLDRKVVAQVVKKLKPLRALMHTMDKLNAFDGAPEYFRWLPSDEEMSAPTAYLANRMMARFKNRFLPGSCLQDGFERMRNELYDDMGAYIKHEVRHGHDQRQAA